MTHIFGGGIQGFIFNQQSASSTWVVNHNLNKSLVTVDSQIFINGTLESVIPNNIIYQDANNVTIQWTHPYSGVARIV